jgi:hypothetical protein
MKVAPAAKKPVLQAFVGAGQEGPAEVQDVLGEGEAHPDEAGVDHPVDHAVELVPVEQRQQQDDRALGALLDHRRDEDRGGGHRFLDGGARGAQDLRRHRVHQRRRRGRDHRAPGEEAGQEQGGFRLEPVHPQERRAWP